MAPVAGIPQPIIPGNLDPYARPMLLNPDGSYSTTSSTSFSTPQGEMLVPTVVDGDRLSPDEAFQRAMTFGEHLGVFRTPEEADRYATWLHNEQQRRLTPIISQLGLSRAAQVVNALLARQNARTVSVGGDRKAF